jgi:hypothetical protein
MKKVLAVLAIGLMVSFSIPSYAQLTDPGDGSGGTSGHDPVGGGAPVGSGIALVLGLGLAYGAKKTYDLKTEE